MKTVYGKLCDECETVRHCSMRGCIPLVTHDGGRTVDSGFSISMHEPRFRLSVRGAVLIGSGLACGALYGFALWLMT